MSKKLNHIISFMLNSKMRRNRFYIENFRLYYDEEWGGRVGFSSHMEAS